MIKTTYILFILIILSGSSCQDDIGELYEGDYLVFGSFYGFCVGDDCLQLFKLEDRQLLEDTVAQYYTEDNLFQRSNRVRSRAELNTAKSLLDVFPKQLLKERDSTFGCPDCYDQGGFYIEYKQGRKRGTWVIDRTQDDVPAYLHEFMDRVDEVIRQLQ